jgi:hypothetical protein
MYETFLLSPFDLRSKAVLCEVLQSKGSNEYDARLSRKKRKIASGWLKKYTDLEAVQGNLK